ncbi:hypothetical protein FCOIX_5830 [Fusarium coicis]|nr:hypothetical protein FCOIX_5830 [Fusarium coicis]
MGSSPDVDLAPNPQFSSYSMLRCKLYDVANRSRFSGRFASAAMGTEDIAIENQGTKDGAEKDTLPNSVIDHGSAATSTNANTYHQASQLSELPLTSRPPMDHYTKDLKCTGCIDLAANVADLQHALTITRIEIKRREIKATAPFQFDKKDMRIIKLESCVNESQEAEIKAAEAAYEECKRHLEIVQSLDCKDLKAKKDECAKLEKDLELEYLVNIRYAEEDGGE